MLTLQNIQTLERTIYPHELINSKATKTTNHIFMNAR